MSSPDALLCWTVTAYRKDGMTEEAYHKYLSEVHGPLVRRLLVKHGFQSYSLVRTLGLARNKKIPLTRLHRSTQTPPLVPRWTRFLIRSSRISLITTALSKPHSNQSTILSGSRRIQNTCVSSRLITRTLQTLSDQGESN
jgi:hypothetical protein